MSEPVSDEELDAVTVGVRVPHNGPVLLVDYDPGWPAAFRAQLLRIRGALGGVARLVEHVGSTSVPGLCAKPVLDIVLAVDDPDDEDSYVPALVNTGFRLHLREPGWFRHRLLKGTEPAVNLHVFAVGEGEVQRMIEFRDRLRANPADRDRYAATKTELAGRTWRHTQHYADAKSAVVRDILGG